MGNGDAMWGLDPFFFCVREGDLVVYEVDVTNAFIVVCNEGEGGVGGDVYAHWPTEFFAFVGLCGFVGVGFDACDVFVIILAYEEEAVVGT